MLTFWQNNVRMLANGFYELGMKPGDSVMAWTDSRSETLTAFYACSMTGLRLVTVDPKIKDADVFVYVPHDLFTISDVLREADPTLLLYSPSSTEGEREGVLKALVPELDSGKFSHCDCYDSSASGHHGGAAEEPPVPPPADCGLHGVGPLLAERRDQLPHAARRPGLPRSGCRGFQAPGGRARDRAAAQLRLLGWPRAEGEHGERARA